MVLRLFFFLCIYFFCSFLYAVPNTTLCLETEKKIDEFYSDEQYLQASEQILIYINCLDEEYNNLDYNSPRYETNSKEGYFQLEQELYYYFKRIYLNQLINSYIKIEDLNKAEFYLNQFSSLPETIAPWSYMEGYTDDDRNRDQKFDNIYNSFKYSFISVIEKNKKNFTLAQDAIIKSILLEFKYDKNSSLWAYSLSLNLNDITINSKNYQKSFEFYKYIESELDKINKSHRNKISINIIAEFYSAFADLYINTSNPVFAIEKVNYFLKNYDTKQLDKEIQTSLFYKLGAAHLSVSKFEKARDLFLKVEKESFEIKNYELTYNSMTLLRAIEIGKSSNINFLKLVERECDFVKKYLSKKSTQYLDCLQNLSMYNMDKNILLSKKYILEAFDLSKSITISNNEKVSLLKDLSKINNKLGNIEDSKNNLLASIALIEKMLGETTYSRYASLLLLHDSYYQYINLLDKKNDKLLIKKILDKIENEYMDNEPTIINAVYYLKKAEYYELIEEFNKINIFLKKAFEISPELISEDQQYKRLKGVYYFRNIFVNNEINEENILIAEKYLSSVLRENLKKENPSFDEIFLEGTLAVTRIFKEDFINGINNINNLMENLIDHLEKNYTNYSNANWNTDDLIETKIPILLVLVDIVIKYNSENEIKNDYIYEQLYDLFSFFSETNVNKSITQTNFRLSQNIDLQLLIKQKSNLEYQINLLEDKAITDFGKNNNNYKINLNANNLQNNYKLQLNKINNEISKVYPDYEKINNYQNLSIKDIQKKLKKDEALVFFIFHNDNSEYLNSVSSFLIKKNNVLLNLSTDIDTLGNEFIPNIVPALKRLREQINLSIQNKNFSNFDLNLSNTIYKILFSNIENELKDINHLLVVNNKYIQKTPLSLLTQSSVNKKEFTYIDYKNADWLIKKFAITYLPSLSSINNIRITDNNINKSEISFLGIGNPILNNKYLSVGNVYRGKLANINELNKLSSLPETQIELETLSYLLNNKIENLFTKKNANESFIKKFNFNHDIIAFATHALVSNDLIGQEEPGLVLTPPELATPENDGLLTASEIMLLDLNAQLVILSACNTANASNERVSLSGLTNSFLFAGTKSILVSNWDVESKSALKLTTKMIENYKKFDDIGFSEALRLSMLELMNDKNPLYSHPVFWAPFILVGEGAY